MHEQLGKSLFKKCMHIIIVGYLPYLYFKLSTNKRHQIGRDLLDSSSYEDARLFAVMYTLTIITKDGETKKIKVVAHSIVQWELRIIR